MNYPVNPSAIPPPPNHIKYIGTKPTNKLLIAQKNYVEPLRKGFKNYWCAQMIGRIVRCWPKPFQTIAEQNESQKPN